ncbi:unnamed protein product [Adineta ricciae]|uniref:Uncharacterized protein n=1 Tax=Adineta ricciae TaxID=249248 RepID=A0A815KDH0_ADIRI|nr:unnamed protein product [Adineta ricciae]
MVAELSLTATIFPFFLSIGAVDAAVTATDHDRKLVSCAPEKGNRAGGDKVFMVLPELDTTAVEALRICFDFASLNQHIIVRHKLIDSKTIEFYTPACLLIPSDQDQMVPIIAIQNDKIIGRFDFVYQSSTIQPTADARLINLLNTSFDDVFPTTSNGPHDIDFGEIVSGLADYSG